MNTFYVGNNVTNRFCVKSSKQMECNKKYESRFAKYMFTNEKKTRVEILKFESKKMRVELKKKILESRKRER